MSSDDAFRYRLWAAVESLRYWAPTITDVARVDSSESAASWTMTIRPFVEHACPLDLTLKATQHFDLTIAGEAYDNRAIASLDHILPLIERITGGHVIQRRWVSTATGAVRKVETLVTLADGSVWQDGREIEPMAGAIAQDATERHDRHFLPYRR
jgi:hypothetical protein